MGKLPQKIKSRTMQIITSIETCSNKYREEIFKAYDYDTYKNIYHLVDESKLSEGARKQLSGDYCNDDL